MVAAAMLSAACSAQPTETSDATGDPEGELALPTLDEAVAAVHSGAPSQIDGSGVSWTFENHALAQLGTSVALVSEGKVVGEDYAHVTEGRLDIAYLERSGGDVLVLERFPAAVTVGSWGAMSEWALVDKFTANPVIYASGGFTGQGTTLGCTILTELTTTGPRTIAVIPDLASGTTLDGVEFETKGKIVAIEQGKSFDVVYSGTDTGRLTYRWDGSEFTTQEEAVLTHCGFE